MNASNPVNTASSASSMEMLRAMVGIGLLCALLIVLTFEGTLPRIERNKAAALEQAIFKVLPGITQTATFYLDQNQNFSASSPEGQVEQPVYAGYDENGKLVGFAIPASGQGYADILRILYGYDPDREAIVGFHVLESKETPGLGDKIEKDPNFLANFEALDVSLTADQSELKNTVVPVKNGTKKNPWEVDAITGATISSRAIGNIIGASTEQWIPLLYKNKDFFEVERPEQENTQQ